MGPDIGLGGFLQVLVAEFEDDLGVSDRKTVLRNAPAQNERIVVEAEVRRVHEEDFPDLEGASTKSLVENATPCSAAGPRITFTR